MMKSFRFLVLIGVGSGIGCASSDLENRIERNYIYQCSLKLFEELGKKVSGADAEKICMAAYKVDGELTSKAPQPVPSISPSPSPTPSISPGSSPTPSAKKSDDLDEIQPEPTPSSN